MARVTAQEVLDIMDGQSISSAAIDACIVGAEEIMNKVFAEDTTIGTVLLKEIERWFVAHMLSLSSARQTVEEKIGDANVKYGGKLGEGLFFTSYGQMVMQLDITGKMVNYVAKRPIKIYAITSFK